MTIDELRQLAEQHTEWPRLSCYEVYHGLVCGSGRCLDDPRYLSEAEQEANVPPLPDEELMIVEAALSARFHALKGGHMPTKEQTSGQFPSPEVCQTRATFDKSIPQVENLYQTPHNRNQFSTCHPYSQISYESELPMTLETPTPCRAASVTYIGRRGHCLLWQCDCGITIEDDPTRPVSFAQLHREAVQG